MEKYTWRHFLEDLLENVISFLPSRSLCRFRTVSKQWNSIVLDAQFQEMCASCLDEFIEGIQRSPKLRDSELVSCTDCILVTVNDNFDIHVVQPLEKFCRQVPRLDLDFNPDENEVDKIVVFSERYVVNVVGDQDINNCSIFVASRSKRISHVIGEQEWSSFLSVHRYDFRTDLWISCGAVREPCERLVQAVKHRGRYFILVETGSWSNPYEGRWHEEDSSTWKPLQGRFPPAFCEILHPVLFDQDGGLLLLIVTSEENCVMWEYQHEKFEWSLDRLFPIIHINQEPNYTQLPVSQCYSEIFVKSKTIRRTLYRYWGTVDVVHMRIEDVKRMLKATLVPGASVFIQPA